MPIGATIGGAVIAAGGGVASGIIGGNAQKDAAQTAADSSYQTAQLNNQLYRDIYGQNMALLTPFSNQGLQASNALTDLLLGTHYFNQSGPTNLGTPLPAPGAAGGGTASSTTGYSGPSFSDILALKGDHTVGDMGAAINQWTSYYQAHPNENPGITPAQIAALTGDHVQGDQEAVQAIYNAYQARPATAAPTTLTPGSGTPAAGALIPYSERGERPDLRGMTAAERGSALDAWRHTGAAPVTTAPPATGATGGATAPSGALSAYDQFKKSINYTGRLAEGQNALDSQWAAHGGLDSGAASKAAIKYGQNFASNELSNYMNLLAGQQAMGLSAAGAVAGVGTSYAGNVASQNTSAANAAANAALANGQAQAGMWGSIGQGAGQIGGALFQYGQSGMSHPAAAPSTIQVTPPSQSNYWQNYGGF